MKKRKLRIFLCTAITLASLLICDTGTLVRAAQPAFNGNPSYEGLNPFTRPNCTWYVWGRVHEVLGIALPYMNDAYTWPTSSSLPEDATTGMEPRLNSIAVWYNGYGDKGHVAFVEEVHEDGSIKISESNSAFGFGTGNTDGYHEADLLPSDYVKGAYRNGEGSIYDEQFDCFIYLTPPPFEVNEKTFPDETFREYVQETYAGQDGVVLEETLARVEHLNLRDCTISNLQGLQYFTSMTRLTLNRVTGFSTLNVNGHTQLEYVDLHNSVASTVSAADCPNLLAIGASENPYLTSVNVSNCPSLTAIGVYRNSALTELDFSGCNNLTQLNVYTNGSLRRLANLPASLTVLNAYSNWLDSADVSACTQLRTLRLNDNRLTGALDVRHMAELQIFHCGNNSFSQLLMGDHPDLTNFTCGNNGFAKLDLSSLSTSLTPTCTPQKAEVKGTLYTDNTLVLDLHSVAGVLGASDITVATAGLFSYRGEYNPMTGIVKFKNFGSSAKVSYTIKPHPKSEMYVTATITADMSCPPVGVRSDVYDVSAKLISGVALGETAQSFLAKMADTGLVMLTAEGTVAIEDAPVGTGMTVGFYDGTVATLSVVVYGDVNGDANINSSDLLFTRRHALGLARLEGAYLEAGCIGASKPDASAILKMRRHILGIESI